jgi:hypothetical protein
MCLPPGPSTTSLNSNPCFIRVSSVAQESLASPLSGTSVRSVAKQQDRASVPHFLDKPRVRPLPTELQIGNLLPAHSSGWLGSTPEGRRPQIRGLRAGGSLAIASSTPATQPESKGPTTLSGCRRAGGPFGAASSARNLQALPATSFVTTRGVFVYLNAAFLGFVETIYDPSVQIMDS